MNISEKNTHESVRIRYKYRNLILRKKINMPLQAAKKIIGPDLPIIYTQKLKRANTYQKLYKIRHVRIRLSNAYQSKIGFLISVCP